MKLVSLTICRNSAWSIQPVIQHALQYCDEAVVLVHASTDSTEAILRGMERVHVSVLPEMAWDEMRHRQQSLDLGRQIGGSHFLILDDDEILAQHLVPRIRPKIAMLAPGQLLRMPLQNLWRSITQYRVDASSPFSRCIKRVAFADAENMHWASGDGYQHHHTHPYGSIPVNWRPDGRAGWMHFQHANWNRLITKQYWYMCMEICRYGEIRANYRGTMREDGLRLASVPSAWLSPQCHAMRLSDTPWQASDLSRMRQERGDSFFMQYDIPINDIINLWP